MDLEKITEELTPLPGKVRGEVFRTHAEYIRFREGEEGVKKVEEKMAELGVPIEFEKIKPFDWVNESTSSLTIIVAKEVFNWTEEDLFQMGRFAVRVSFFIKLIIQYFVSMERVLKEASKHWRRHFDFGSLEVAFFDEKKKTIILRVKDFKTHPLICCFHAGYFQGVTEFAVRSEKVTVEEVKCIYKGDDSHDYKITWI